MIVIFNIIIIISMIMTVLLIFDHVVWQALQTEMALLRSKLQEIAGDEEVLKYDTWLKQQFDDRRQLFLLRQERERYRQSGDDSSDMLFDFIE